MVLIRKATLLDLDHIYDLIHQDHLKNILLPVPKDILIDWVRDFFVVFDDLHEIIVGCSALHIYTSQLAEIRSLTVKKEFQSKGIGQSLIQACIDEAKGLKIKSVFVLTKKNAFFNNLGFNITKKNDLPEKVYKDCLHCTRKDQCDENAFVMNFF